MVCGVSEGHGPARRGDRRDHPRPRTRSAVARRKRDRRVGPDVRPAVPTRRRQPSIERSSSTVTIRTRLSFLVRCTRRKASEDSAVAAYQQAIALGLDTPAARIGLGAAYARAGHRDRALAILTELRAGNAHVSPADLAILLTGLGEREAGLRVARERVSRPRHAAAVPGSGIGVRSAPNRRPVRRSSEARRLEAVGASSAACGEPAQRGERIFEVVVPHELAELLRACAKSRGQQRRGFVIHIDGLHRILRQ